MVFSLVLNSTNSVGNSNTLYRYSFLQGTLDIHEGAEICVSQIVMPYSFPNISVYYSNKTLSYIWNGVSGIPPTCIGYINGTTLTLSISVTGLTNCVITGLTSILSNTYVVSGFGTVWTVNISQTSGSASSPNIFTVTGSFNTIVIPDGFYTTSDINSYLSLIFVNKGHYLYDTLNAKNVYYMSLTTNVTYYGVQLICNPIPDVLPSSFLDPTGLFPFSPTLSCPQLVIYPKTTEAALYPNVGIYSNFSTLIGFSYGVYPSSALYTTSYNVLSSFTPNASQVNSIVVLCDKVYNPCTVPSTILDTFSINTTYGSNIIYQPSYEKWTPLTPGKYAFLSINLVDQNLNVINALDNNILINLMIRNGEKVVNHIRFPLLKQIKFLSDSV